MRNSETQSAGIHDVNLNSPNPAGDHEQTWDAVETYFEPSYWSSNKRSSRQNRY